MDWFNTLIGDITDTFSWAANAVGDFLGFDWFDEYKDVGFSDLIDSWGNDAPIQSFVGSDGPGIYADKSMLDYKAPDSTNVIETDYSDVGNTLDTGDNYDTASLDNILGEIDSTPSTDGSKGKSSEENGTGTGILNKIVSIWGSLDDEDKKVLGSIFVSGAKYYAATEGSKARNDVYYKKIQADQEMAAKKRQLEREQMAERARLEREKLAQSEKNIDKTAEAQQRNYEKRQVKFVPITDVTIPK